MVPALKFYHIPSVIGTRHTINLIGGYPFHFGMGAYLDRIWTTAAQLTTNDYNSRQLIKPGGTMANVMQVVVVSCG